MPSFWNNGHSVIIGTSEIPTEITAAKQQSEKLTDSRQQNRVTDIPTSPRIHADEGSSPTASLRLVSVREQTGSDGHVVNVKEENPALHCQARWGSSRLQRGPRAPGQREVSPVSSWHGPPRTGVHTPCRPLGVASALSRKQGRRQRPRKEKVQVRVGETQPHSFQI